jgi:primosomal protein N' (replication factor Y)
VLVQTRMPDHEVLDAAVHADPGRLVPPELERRTALRFPPATAMAVVSGPAAPELVERLEQHPVELLGPDDGRWLVRTDTSAQLADAFAAAGRPAGRLRIEVDPLRI